MRKLLQSLDKWPRGWADKNIVLFLDYDGTLTPIVEDPAKALLPKANKDLLLVLARIPHCRTVIMSGRSLEDVKALVAIDDIDYVGNHGWEVGNSHHLFESLVPVQTSSALDQISLELATKLSLIKGAKLEDKGITLSVHYRQVAKENVPVVKKTVKEVCRAHCKHGNIQINMGKKVLEVRPAIEWDKGKAALWLLKRQEFLWDSKDILPIYIGDDITDEDAFADLKGKGGITVLVGSARTSHAQYHLDSPADVTKFLRCLAVSMSMSVRDKATV